MIAVDIMRRCKNAANKYSDLYVKNGSETFCEQWKTDVENEVYSFSEQFIIITLTNWYIEVKRIPINDKRKLERARQALSELQRTFFEITSIEDTDNW